MILDELDDRLDRALSQLYYEVIALSIFLPDLCERQKRLIDNVLSTVHDWEVSRRDRP